MALRLPLLGLLAIFFFAVVRVAMVWDSLPSVMASHFGPSGQPDGFMSRGAFFAVFGIIAGGVCLLMFSMRWVLPRVPTELINMPNRDYWLSPGRRDDSLSRLSDWMDWFAVATAAFLAFVLELTLQANVSRSALANAPFIVGLIGYLALTVVLVVALYRRFRVPGVPEQR